MGFLFPLYLLGALAIAIPVVLHLRRRPPRDRVEFSSLMFLQPNPRVQLRRRRLENMTLLALRSAAVLILALLFARPFWRGAPADVAAGAARVILIDRSASMRREGVWQEARKAVAAELARSAPDDAVSLLAFGGKAEVVLSFDEWKQWPREARTLAAQERVRGLEPGWQGTDLGRALLEALGLLEEETAGKLAGRRAEIAVVSDWQSGARVAALEGFSWPESVVVRRVEVQPSGPARSNAAVHLVANAAVEEGETGENAPLDPPVRVRVTNGPESARERFHLRWEGGESGLAVDLTVPAGGSRVVTAPPRRGAAASLCLEGDEEPFDNRLFVAPREPRPVRVLYMAERVEEGDAQEPLYYLRRALNESGSLRPELVGRRLAELAEAELMAADVLVLAGEPVGEQLTRIERFLEEGGMVWLALREGMDGSRLPVVRAWGATVRELKADGYALWSGMDFQHPLLRPFAPAALRDFSRIRVWSYRKLTFPGEMPEGVTVAARYDQGGPALLVATVGRGRLCLLPGGWLPRDSQLALSTKFVPLLYSMLRHAGFESDAPRQFSVGDELPGGGVATEPGIFPAKGAGKDGRGGTTTAVNLPVTESDLEPLDETALARFGLVSVVAPPGGAAVAMAGADDPRSGPPERQQRVRLEELEARQRLWRWLTLAVVLFLLVETWLSRRTSAVSPVEPAA